MPSVLVLFPYWGCLNSPRACADSWKDVDGIDLLGIVDFSTVPQCENLLNYSTDPFLISNSEEWQGFRDPSPLKWK